MIRLPVSREDEWKDSSGCLLLLRASFRRNILHSVDCTFTKKTFLVVHKMSRYTWSKNKKQRQCQTCRRSFFVLLKLLHGYTLLFVTAGILTSGLTPSFIRSMRTGPRHWRARGHREITWSFTKVFFKFPKCFVSRLFQFFFLVLRISNGCLWWYLWVDSASCMIKRFVVMFIATAIMCRHSQPHCFTTYIFVSLKPS